MPPRLALAALLLLRDYLTGVACPTAETSDRVDALLRPLREGPDGLLLDALKLKERIRELERIVDNETLAIEKGRHAG